MFNLFENVSLKNMLPLISLLVCFSVIKADIGYVNGTLYGIQQSFGIEHISCTYEYGINNLRHPCTLALYTERHRLFSNIPDNFGVEFIDHDITSFTVGIHVYHGTIMEYFQVRNSILYRCQNISA